MLTTVAVLVIVFGLMVSLARDVRRRSAAGLTEQILAKMDVLMAEYVQQYGNLPAVYPLLPSAVPGQPFQPPDERTLRQNAELNNERLIHQLRGSALIAKDLAEFPTSIYNEASLVDAWGSPIVLMPSMHTAIGMAPENHSFLFSAGPDRRYLTRDDNLYSYDQSAAPASTRPATMP